MKFGKKEYDALIVEIKNAALGEMNFDFVKRQGWLFVEDATSKNSFCFHRKKESHIVDGNFQDRIFYWINKEKDTEIDNWEDVVNEFRNWLAQMNDQTIKNRRSTKI